MDVPHWITRKLFRRGSLQETRHGFTFVLQNVLQNAHLIAPPRIVVNGIRHPPGDIRAKQIGGTAIDVPGISKENPMPFPKGSTWRLEMPGHLLAGPNRVQVVATTKEFGDLEIFVEDRAMGFCDIGGEEE